MEPKTLPRSLRRSLAAVAMSCAFALPQMAPAQNSETPPQERLKVAMLTTLSGGGSALGKDIRDGFLLALKLDPDAPLDVNIVDDERNPERAVELVNKMLGEDYDVFTGLVFSNLAVKIVPLVTENNKIYVSPNAAPSLLAGEKCHKYYFSVSWQNDTQHEAMGEYMYREGYQLPFVVAPDYPAGHDAATGFKRFYGPVVAEEFTKLGQKDYSEVIEKIKASEAETVYYFLPGAMGVNFIKQFSESGAPQILFGPASSFDQTILDAIGDVAIGVYNTSQWVKEIDYPQNVIFVEEFFKAYDRYPSHYAQQGYDAALILIAAMKETDTPHDVDALRQAILDAKFDSPRGAFRFDTSQHPIQDFVVRQVVRDENGLTNKFVDYAMYDRGSEYVDECHLGKE